MEPLLLLRGVRDVSLLVDPEQPTGITQRAFDAARAESAVPNLPRAKRIVELLNAKRQYQRLTWAGVLELAHSLPAEQERSISALEAVQQTWLTDQQIVFALRLVSIRLGAEGFSEYTYVHELQKMRDENIDVAGLRLPSGSQIVAALARKLDRRLAEFPAHIRLPQARETKRSERTTKRTARGKARKRRSRENAWVAALEMAGLREVERPKSVSNVELLERCYAAHRVQPTKDDARAFARTNGITYGRRTQKLNWAESVAAWKKQLEADGIVPPEKPPALDKRPDYSRNPDRPAPPQRQGWADMDACLTDMCAYLEQAAPGERSTYRGFQRWMRSQNRIPPAHEAFRKHGGWKHVREIAQERIHPGLKPTEPPSPDTAPKTRRSKTQKIKPTSTDHATPTPQPPITLLLRLPPKPKKRRHVPKRRTVERGPLVSH